MFFCSFEGIAPTLRLIPLSRFEEDSTGWQKCISRISGMNIFFVFCLENFKISFVSLLTFVIFGSQNLVKI